MSLLTAKQLAKILGFSYSTINRYSSQHPEKLPPSIEVLGQKRWELEDVESWLQARKEVRDDYRD